MESDVYATARAVTTRARHIDTPAGSKAVIAEIAGELTLIEGDELAAGFGGARCQLAINVGEQSAGLILIAIDDVWLR